MIKRYFSILALSFVAFTACVNDVLPENEVTSTDQIENPVQITFTALGGNLAKTTLNQNEVLWETGDAIKVLWGENKSVKAVGEVYNTQLNADFKATVEKAEAYYGVYPYDMESSLDGSSVTVTVPEVQTGLFKDSNVIVAKANADYQMQFRHALSYLEFTIDKPGTLTFSCGNPVAGKVTMSFNDDGTVSHDVIDGAMIITIDVKVSGTYYIAMLPDVKLDMLSFQLTDDSGSKYINAMFDRTMSRGKILGIGNITDRFSGYSVGATLESFKLVEFDFQSF